MANILLNTDCASWFVDHGDSIALHSLYPTPHPCGVCGRMVTLFVNCMGKTRCSSCDAKARMVN